MLVRMACFGICFGICFGTCFVQSPGALEGRKEPSELELKLNKNTLLSLSIADVPDDDPDNAFFGKFSL